MKTLKVNFAIFLSVVEYLITRLRNHAKITYYTDDINNELSVSFIAFIDDLPFEQGAIFEVLDFFSNGNGYAASQRIVDYKLVDNEIHLTIDGKGNIELLQSIYNNLRKIKNNKSACDFFMKFAQISTFYQNEYIFSKQIADAGVKYILEFTEHSDENIEIIDIIQNIWNERYNFPNLKDNEAGYYEKANEIVQSIEIDSDKEKPPTKVRLRTVCNKLILELIPQYLDNPKYKEGGFNQELYEEIKAQIKKMYSMPTSFTRNIFNEEWKNVIDGNKEKYGHLSNPGRRYNKEAEN